MCASSICRGWSRRLFPGVLTLPTLCCSGSLAKRTARGNTPLHYCCSHNKPECVKLLLKAKANITISEWPRDPPPRAHTGCLLSSSLETPP